MAAEPLITFFISEKWLKISVMLIVLLIASIKDVRDRTIPDWMPFFILIASFIPDGWPLLSGIPVAVLLLIAAVTIGGIGGGDIKIVGAVGLVIGFRKNLISLILALALMLLFHLVTEIQHKLREKVRRCRVKHSSSAIPRSITRDSEEITADDFINGTTDAGNTADKRNHASYPMVPFIFAGTLISVIVLR